MEAWSHDKAKPLEQRVMQFFASTYDPLFFVWINDVDDLIEFRYQMTPA
jgi:hypothetical protein